MLIEGFFILNYLVSIYLIFTPFLILTLKPKANKHGLNDKHFITFFNIFTTVLIIVNISAFLYAIVVLSTAAYPDDVFTGLYGKNGFGSHSLSLINSVVCVYYMFNKKIKRFIFFFVCSILGFYGLGLVIFLVAIIIFSLPYLVKKIGLILKGIAISTILLAVINTVNPKNIDYILLNFRDVFKVFTTYDYYDEMERANNFERTFVPRYFTFIDGTRRLFFSDAKVFLLGTSPGTYNSRTAFYLNGDFLRNDFVERHFSENTTYHEEFVKPILNWKLLKSSRWNDGTRNQPFSSIVSVFLEYGIIIGFLFFTLLYRRIIKIKKLSDEIAIKNYVTFLIVFLLLLLTFQNYLEYPEILLYFIMAFKLIEIDNVNRQISEE